VHALPYLLATYAIASLSFSQLIARAHGVDLRSVGTRNLGAGNLARNVGPLQGATGGLLDALKAPLAILLARAFGADGPTQIACGVVAIAAQQWPVWHRFDGGRGNAPALALLIVLSLPAALLVAPVALVGIFWGVGSRRRSPGKLFSRGTPLGILLAFSLYPPAVLAVGDDPLAAMAGLATTLLVIARRLTAGIREDMRASRDRSAILVNRMLYDRTEEQRRALEEPA
jgi:glycerol-3-phosphate acyltransferase PlsY